MWVLFAACSVRHPPVVVPPQPAELERRDLSRMTPEEQRALLRELGQRVYETGDGGPPCALCHGADGSGVPGAFPPIVAEGEWFTDCAAAGALVRDGRFGELRVGGQLYGGVMMPYGERYNDLQVAAVITWARGLAAPAATQCLPSDVRAR